MAFPTITVEAAFGDPPFDTAPTYTDLSTYARLAKTKRGRPSNLAKIEAGSAEVLLDNRDLRFDPTNASGAYYPNVKPGVRFRVSATYSSVTYRLFTGYALRWPPDWKPPGYTETKVELRDVFDLLAKSDLLEDTYPAELVGTRIGRALDAVGFPAGLRSIDPGILAIESLVVGGADRLKCLAHILDAAESELGVFFIAGDGTATYRDRQDRIDSAADYTSTVTFGDGGGTELQYESVKPDYDVERVVNDWRLTPAGGGDPVVKEDAASIDAYGRRTSTRSPFTTSTIELTVQAEYLLALTKDPQLRFDSLTIRPSAFATGTLRDNLFVAALDTEIGDRVTVKVRPPNGAYTITQDCNVEGIEHEMSDNDWVTTFRLAPVDPNTVGGSGYWILGDATYSLLGVSTRLAP